MADDATNETPGTGDAGGADETQAGWAAPGQAPREPAPPASPAPGEQSQPPPPPPPEQTASAAWQAAPAAPRPPGPARRGGRTWLVVLVALLSVTVIMVIVGSVLFANRTLPPYHGAHDFLSDVIHGRASEAGARLCADDRENPERALSKVSSTFDGGKILVNPFDVDRTGDHALVSYSVDLPGTSRSPSYDLPMREEGGHWLACPLSGEG